MQWTGLSIYIVHTSMFIFIFLNLNFCLLFNIRMKVAFVLIFCLPCLFAETASDVALDAYKRMTPEERMSGKVNLKNSQYSYRFCFWKHWVVCAHDKSETVSSLNVMQKAIIIYILVIYIAFAS